MAINKDSNSYTFVFAIVLITVVGTILALLAMGLKPMQAKNDEVKKKLDVLSALMTPKEMETIDRSNAAEIFEKYVNLEDALVLDAAGKVKEGLKAFDIDIRREYKDKKLQEADRNYPLFIAKKDGKTFYIIPMIGKGLWGPIWGNVCLAEDMKTIQGASFGHQGETPGLGAEISQPFFVNRWIGEQISDESNEFSKFEIVKDGSGAAMPSRVDGITGGTITSVGVQEMANRCLKVYVTYFNNL
jgi:Na+-transporting NADH:ubiquinone oxidoreductase subunit C